MSAWHLQLSAGPALGRAVDMQCRTVTWPCFSQWAFASPVLIPKPPSGTISSTDPGTLGPWAPHHQTSQTLNHTLTSVVLHPEDSHDNMQEASGF